MCSSFDMSSIYTQAGPQDGWCDKKSESLSVRFRFQVSRISRPRKIPFSRCVRKKRTQMSRKRVTRKHSRTPHEMTPRFYKCIFKCALVILMKNKHHRFFEASSRCTTVALILLFWYSFIYTFLHCRTFDMYYRNILLSF